MLQIISYGVLLCILALGVWTMFNVIDSKSHRVIRVKPKPYQGNRPRPRSYTPSRTEDGRRVVEKVMSNQPIRPTPVNIPDTFSPKTTHRRLPSRDYPNLIRLAGGDKKTADRLLQLELDRNPEKSEQWCYEKALYDLQRDKMR